MLWSEATPRSSANIKKAKSGEQDGLEFICRKREDYLANRKPSGNKYDMRLQDEMSLHFSFPQVNSMRAALAVWGEASQVGMAVEECAELIVALQKYINRTPAPDTLENIMDEIADVERMLAQMRLTFGISDEMVAKRIKQKFSKLDEYLKRDSGRGRWHFTSRQRYPPGVVVEFILVYYKERPRYSIFLVGEKL